MMGTVAMAGAALTLAQKVILAKTVLLLGGTACASTKGCAALVIKGVVKGIVWAMTMP